MRSAFLLGALLSIGCDAFHDELPGLFVARPRAEASASQAPKASDSLARVARQLENKFKPPALPTVGSGNDCSRAPLLEVANAESRRLVLANIDVRKQTKNLIPRRVSERLESGESALLGTLFESSVSNAQRNVPASAMSLTREDLDRIQRQRYLGVFYLTDYQGPNLIAWVGKIRREWLAGILSARFVLFDTEQERMICATDLRVTNDVQSAPIRTRLQAETRGRLERDLGDALRVAAERALGSFAQQLQWPDSGIN